MHYLTAVEAARRIGVAEKTIRLWVKAGKLSNRPGDHPTNRLAIPVSEVERLAREREQYYGKPLEQEASSGASEAELAELRARLEQLEAEVRQLRTQNNRTERHERGPVSPLPVSLTHTNTAPSESSLSAINEHSRILPDKYPARQYARDYGVTDSTFRTQYETGKVEIACEIDRSRNDGKKKWYVLPEQERAVLEYWLEHDSAKTQEAREKIKARLASIS